MFDEIIGTQAASCERVMLVLVWQIFWAEDKKGAGKHSLEYLETVSRHLPDTFQTPSRQLYFPPPDTK